MRPTNPSFWNRMREFAQRVNVDSIKVGPASLRFQPRQQDTDSYASISAKVVALAGRSNDVLVLSAHNVDEVTVVDRIEADHECEALGPAQRCPGGSGANTAYAMALLGASVEAAGCVGSDADADLLISSLANVGVGVELITRVEAQLTGHTHNIVDFSGRRLLVVHPNANDAFGETADAALLAAAASNSKILHLSSFVDERALALQTRLAKDVGDQLVVSLTPGALYARRGLDRLEDLIANVDMLFLYREQLVTLIDESSARPLKRGETLQDLVGAFFAWKRQRSIVRPQIVIVKDPLSNSAGAVAQRFLAVASGRDRLERFFFPRELPRNVRIQTVDMTGAGDAAAAGFLTGLLDGASMEAALDGSFLLASFVSTSLGARGAFGEEPNAIGGSASSPVSLPRAESGPS